MKRRQEAAEEAERQRLKAEEDARAAAEAEAEAKRQSEASQVDAPGSPQRERDAGNFRHRHPLFHSIAPLFDFLGNQSFNSLTHPTPNHISIVNLLKERLIID